MGRVKKLNSVLGALSELLLRIRKASTLRVVLSRLMHSRRLRTVVITHPTLLCTASKVSNHIKCIMARALTVDILTDTQMPTVSSTRNMVGTT